MITIREVTIGDVPLLVQMGKETFENAFAKDNSPENMSTYLTEAFNKEKIERELLDVNCKYFLAFENDNPAGYAKMRVSDEVKHTLKESAIELERIYVVASFIGKRVGAKLMQKCLDYAKENKFYWIWLGVWERNYTAQNFYKKWEFEKFGEHVFRMGDDPQTDWLMKKIVN